MNEYSLYPVADTGHVLGPARKLTAKDDGDALSKACNFQDCEALEIWRGSQYITTVTRNPASRQSDWIIVIKD